MWTSFMTVYIGLLNPKSPTNVGSVLRAAGCYQADAVFYTGQRYTRAVKFNTDTKKSHTKIPLIAVDNILAAKKQKMKVVCVDLVEDAIPLPEYQHPQDVLYIFGPEDGSIDQHIITLADEVVYVPTIGCMNLAASTNVVLYDRLSKQKNTHYSNELILKSRDRNNKTRVKN
jgi:tRNA(Leu) C34 or U34 (ribose-2'-O)-methylase TrmL